MTWGIPEYHMTSFESTYAKLCVVGGWWANHLQKLTDLLSVIWAGNEAQHVGDRLHEAGHRGDELQLSGESAAPEEPGHGDDGGVEHVHQEPG